MPKAKILCVDDTSENLEVLIELLSEYDVIVSIDAQNALKILERNEVDMILLDIMMPVMDGFTLCQKIKEQKHLMDIPLLFLSAKTDEESIERGYELGALDYVSKPFKPRELLSRVKTHLKLRAYSNDLELEVERTLEKQRHQEHLVIRQSYAASMGQMIDVVAHQWLQPLNVVNMRLSKLLLDYDDMYVDRKYLEIFQNKSLAQIRHLVQTLNEFRSFMSPNKKREIFSLEGMIKKVMVLIKDELEYYQIRIEIDCDEDFEVDAIENEFIHIILNLINNAKEAFVEKNIQNRHITLALHVEDRSLHIIDNAGGIELENIDDVFELHVSSKKTTGGSGLGLYMSKMIVDKYEGSINVCNSKDGAHFILSFSKPTVI